MGRRRKRCLSTSQAGSQKKSLHPHGQDFLSNKELGIRRLRHVLIMHLGFIQGKGAHGCFLEGPVVLP